MEKSHWGHQNNEPAKALLAVSEFKSWLNSSGRGYLHSGVEKLPPGKAFEEIFRRAGIPINGSDEILATINKARSYIEENCPPKSQHN